MNTGKSVRTPAATNTGERTSATITASRPLGRSSHPMGSDSIAGSHSPVARPQLSILSGESARSSSSRSGGSAAGPAPTEPKADPNDQECRAKEHALAQEKTATKADGIRRQRGGIMDVGWNWPMRFG